MLRDTTPRFVGPSIRPSHFTFFSVFCSLWPHCSCPNDQVTSNTAPAHLHATGVAVYLTLFSTVGDDKTRPDTRPISSRLRVGSGSMWVGGGRFVAGQGAVMLRFRVIENFPSLHRPSFGRPNEHTGLRTNALSKRLKTVKV